jgi:hypothetical protein
LLPGCKCGQTGACCPAKAGPAVAPTNAPAVAATGNQPHADAVTLAEDEELLFDGKTMKGWKITEFAGHGEVEVKDGKIIMNQGVMTGVNYTNNPPRMNYEVTYEGCRVDGSDFFASLTFPFDDTCCTLIAGGWGGGLVGISSIDGMDASENETTQFVAFENGKWYRFRVRVTKDKIEAWVDDKQVAKVNTKGRKIDIRPGEIEGSRPFGFATWATTGAIKNIKLKRLD